MLTHSLACLLRPCSLSRSEGMKDGSRESWAHLEKDAGHLDGVASSRTKEDTENMQMLTQVGAEMANGWECAQNCRERLIEEFLIHMRICPPLDSCNCSWFCLLSSPTFRFRFRPIFQDQANQLNCPSKSI